MDLKILNIPEDLLDESIYRIIPFDRFMEALEFGINIFVRPYLWDDPFENILTYPSQVKKTKEHLNEKFYIYAQCWSFSGENDLLWRTYSKNSDGIRIRSTPRKLIESIHYSDKIYKIENFPNSIYYDDEVQIDEEIHGFIGKVQYMSYEKIADYLSNRIYKNDLTSYFETLLIKRDAFKNEEELRIGIRHYFGYDDIILQLSDDIFKYDIKINKVIDEVVFDPRISTYKFNGLKKQIKKYGFENPVMKSNLYDIPQIDQIIK
ncbi:MAG: DUF2971 domain-containing protein [Flavobacterium sp.]|jgi:hypothetical protein|nr:DUF2971 domain-containing protein [Flavobacterium sp.]